MEETNPESVFVAFLEALPATIKELILARACLGYGKILKDEQTTDLVVFLALALPSDDWLYRTYDLAKAIGVVELALEDSAPNADLEKDLFAKTGSDIFQRRALQAPLSQRHAEGARLKFQELRRGMLSPYNLRIWQERRMAESPLLSMWRSTDE